MRKTIPFLMAGALVLGSAGAEICGSSSSILWAGQHMDAGSVTISNTETDVSVTFAASGDWEICETHLHIATSLEDIPQTRAGNPKIGNFAFKGEHDPCVQTFTYTFAYDELAAFLDIDVVNCGPGGTELYFAAHAVVTSPTLGSETAWGEGPGFPGRSWAMYNSYTPICCENPPGPLGQLRTQTQGGWGTSCSGNNPGCYRDTNFDAAFPNGLVIGGGCVGAYTITFTSSAAVQDFLPNGGTPAALTESLVDPVGRITVLAGQVAALSLSVGFDDNDPNFGASSTRLGDAVLCAGSLLDGLTVDQILALGNEALGGCPTAYNIGDINDALATINQNFVDGDNDEGDLDTTCP
jgi:hypothetical protein